MNFRLATLRWVVLSALVAGIVWGFLLVQKDPSRLNPENIRAFIESFGAWAPAIYLIVYGQPFVPLPFLGMGIASGLAFGPVAGVAVCLAGAVLRAAAMYGIAHTFGIGFLPQKIRALIEQVRAQVRGAQFRTVFLVRFVPNFPYDVQSYALGLSGVKLGAYLLGTCLGILPISIGLVILGDAMTNLSQLAVVIGVVLAIATVALVAVFRRSAKRG